jgi:uncharacterized protein YbcV (DUF1398 family)
MFTVDQIKAAHSKVKAGADFPAYIQDIKKMGVSFYETFVNDGHTDYYGANGYKTSAVAKYGSLTIAHSSNIERFKKDIKAHQQGKTTIQLSVRIVQNQVLKNGRFLWTK